MRLALVCFYCLCVFVYVLYFIATMSFAGYFLSVLFCLLSMLISDSRFDLVWFRLSCDHGWIRSGSVNVRKQQQQQQRSVKSKHILNIKHDKSVVVCCYIEYVPSVFSSTVLSGIYGRVACSTVCTYVLVCCYSSRLVMYQVCTEHQQYSTI